MGVCGCVHSISISILRNGVVYFAVIKSAAISASAADAITVLIFEQLLKLFQLVLVLVHFMRGIYELLICF